MKKINLLPILSLCLFGLVSHAGDGVNEFLRKIPVGEWIELGNTGDDKIPAGITGYSGMAMDTRNHQVLVFGGGHDDYWGNEVFAFDIETLKWKRMYEPNPPSDYTWDNVPDIEGRVTDHLLENTGLPMSRHTYDNVKFIEHAGVMVTFGGYTAGAASSFNIPIGMKLANDTWTYDYKKNLNGTSSSDGWVQRAKMIDRYDVTGASSYDPGSGLLISFAGQKRKTRVFDLDNNQWSTLETNTPSGRGETAMVYDSKRKVHYLHGGQEGCASCENDMWEFSYSTRTWRRLASSHYSGQAGMVYDSAADRVISCTGQRMEVYNPNNNTWTKMSDIIDGIKCPMRFSNSRIHGSFVYNKVNNVSILLRSFYGNYSTFVYKHVGNVVDSVKPAAPSDLRVSE